MPQQVEKHDKTQPKHVSCAPSGPGTKPMWTSGAKMGVGTAVANSSHLWFTIGQGVLNEVYFPDVDIANTRSLRFLVADGADFFSDEQDDADHVVTAIEPGVPAYTVVSTCKRGRYRLRKRIVTASARETLLLKVQFEVLDASTDLALYFYVDPHLGDLGKDNTGWVGDYQGVPMLFAQRAQTSLAVHASLAFLATSCGFVGVNDGFEDLKKHRRLVHDFNLASKGNIGLCAQLDWKACDGEMVVAIAFGQHPEEAGQHARAGTLVTFDTVWDHYVRDWRALQGQLLPLAAPPGSAHELYRISAAVMRTHESKGFPGAFIASLSLPWGFSHGDEDVSAYHVIWPRDLCETSMGLMACGELDAGRRSIFYLACTQKEDGSWSQNMWLDGSEHWGAIQMDGIAMPILLADQLRRADALEHFDPWPMIRKAAQFLLRNGPCTGQDRWEALPGYATFTMACEIAALLAAADFADRAGAAAEATLLRETADAWNDAIDTLTYASGTELARAHGVEGYYLRLAPKDAITNPHLNDLNLRLANHGPLSGHYKAVQVVSPDALALVRFGLRAADDPRMVATAAVLDATLRREMTTGPGWIRGTDDGYGEKKDGRPYDKTGIGHCWPLLAGERGHFELAAGRPKVAEELLRVISRQTSVCGMIPEQVWSAPDIPEHDLFNGHPAGSGMPLAWAHAEYAKLVRSLADGHIWDLPPQTVQRYQVERQVAAFEIWTEDEQRRWITPGKQLRMDFGKPATIRWKVDRQADAVTVNTAPPVLTLHSALLRLPPEWSALTIVVETEGETRHLHLIPR